MKIVGRTSLDGPPVLESWLPHGADPLVLVFDAGFVADRPLQAYRSAAGELVLEFEVRTVDAESRPTERSRGQDPGLVLGPDEVPDLRQRVAAYAIVTSDRGLLATQYSEQTSVEGRWGMPGGGIDPDEQPMASVLREVHEETAQVVELGDLVAVQTSHWIGRSPRRSVEDFHAVRLIYTATCPQPGEPVVLDEGGTTADARWVPLPTWRSLPWTVNWRQALSELL